MTNFAYEAEIASHKGHVKALVPGGFSGNYSDWKRLEADVLGNGCSIMFEMRRFNVCYASIEGEKKREKSMTMRCGGP